MLVPVTPSEREVFDYELPEGAQAVLPADTKLHTPFGRVEVSYQLARAQAAGGDLHRAAPADRGDHGLSRLSAAFCKTADAALQREVRIVLP